MDNLPVKPQLKVDAQILSVFCQVVSQAANQLSGMTDSSSAEYVSLDCLMKHNLSQVIVAAQRLESDLA